MDKLIKKINEMIAEHEDENWCTDYYEAETLDEAWEAGMYETLIGLLDDLKRIDEGA